MAVTMKVVVRDMMLCGDSVNAYTSPPGWYAARSGEMSVLLYQSTWHHVLEYCSHQAFLFFCLLVAMWSIF